MHINSWPSPVASKPERQWTWVVPQCQHHFLQKNMTIKTWGYSSLFILGSCCQSDFSTSHAKFGCSFRQTAASSSKILCTFSIEASTPGGIIPSNPLWMIFLRKQCLTQTDNNVSHRLTLALSYQDHQQLAAYVLMLIFIDCWLTNKVKRRLLLASMVQEVQNR